MITKIVGIVLSFIKYFILFCFIHVFFLRKSLFFSIIITGIICYLIRNQKITRNIHINKGISIISKISGFMLIIFFAGIGFILTIVLIFIKIIK